MKKILILSLLLLNGCFKGNDSPIPVPVLRIYSFQSANNLCIYYIDDVNDVHSNFSFIDSCGKFMVGDTVKIIKTSEICVY